MMKPTHLIMTILSMVLLNNAALQAQKLHKKLANYCTTIESEFDQIPEARKAELEELGKYIFEKASNAEPIAATVICTHNSRRSHMGQLWIQTAAAYYGIENVKTYSGGTEATAFNPRAVKALRHAGFKIKQLNAGDNPPYEVTLGSGMPEMIMFSKKYGDPHNPASDFVAIMVCSEADASCPIVPGADARFAIPYRDPKYSDDTPEEETAYDDTCRQIAREMFYAVKSAKDALVVEMEKAKGE